MIAPTWQIELRPPVYVHDDQWGVREIHNWSSERIQEKRIHLHRKGALVIDHLCFCSQIWWIIQSFLWISKGIVRRIVFIAGNLGARGGLRWESADLYLLYIVVLSLYFFILDWICIHIESSWKCPKPPQTILNLLY